MHINCCVTEILIENKTGWKNIVLRKKLVHLLCLHSSFSEHYCARSRNLPYKNDLKNVKIFDLELTLRGGNSSG